MKMLQSNYVIEPDEFGEKPLSLVALIWILIWKVSTMQKNPKLDVDFWENRKSNIN